MLYSLPLGVDTHWLTKWRTGRNSSDLVICAGLLQVRFEQPICLTGIKVGAAPGTGPGAAVTPHIHLFAYDLSTLGAARFAVLTENCTLPASGTKAVRIEVRFTCRAQCASCVEPKQAAAPISSSIKHL